MAPHEMRVVSRLLLSIIAIAPSACQRSPNDVDEPSVSACVSGHNPMAFTTSRQNCAEKTASSRCTKSRSRQTTPRQGSFRIDRSRPTTSLENSWFARSTCRAPFDVSNAMFIDRELPAINATLGSEAQPTVVANAPLLSGGRSRVQIDWGDAAVEYSHLLVAVGGHHGYYVVQVPDGETALEVELRDLKPDTEGTSLPAVRMTSSKVNS